MLVGTVAAMTVVALATAQAPISFSAEPCDMQPSSYPRELKLTSKLCGHILTNVNVWSPDSKWIVYDTRSDPAGKAFDGRTIEAVHVDTGEVRIAYESHHGAFCGVATFHPVDDKIVFIHGPEHPAAGWQYSPFHRRGVIVDLARPGVARSLDARDIVPPFTPGALRGGSHVHVFSDDGQLVSFTYEDHVLSSLESADGEPNQRNIGVSVAGRGVTVPNTHPRNHDGDYYTVLVTRTAKQPQNGTDEISRACEEGWIGDNGYQRVDGTWQRRALAFQGEVATDTAQKISEVFVVDLPEDFAQASDGPLQGTASIRPRPPRGTRQRRLTYTSDRKFPGIQGPRHWLRSSPDGARIAFLMRDDAGVVQIWAVSPNGGQPVQVTRDPWDIGSAFTWRADGRSIAYIADGSVLVVDPNSGMSRRLTEKRSAATVPRPEACVFSPDSERIAYVRPVESDGQTFNQVFVVAVEE
ncbi:MAG: DUF3748 domain-containing protein [Pirellulales bacterium]